MRARSSKSGYSLYLRTGEMVEIRNKEEILSTLDKEGKLDGLPFMPEMLKYCGQRFRVFKRADKTCDTITNKGLRRMQNAVHLEGVRCDGTSHGGCEAECLLFWKEAWLKRVGRKSMAGGLTARNGCRTEINEGRLLAHTRVITPSGEEVFSCQATELNRATSELSLRALGQYVTDVRSGNVRIRDVVRWVYFDVVTMLMQIKGYRALLWTYNRLSRLLGGVDYPTYQGTLTKTPVEYLGLQRGEMVRIKDRAAIVATLDQKNKNRGLSFDIEMINFCGGMFRVRKRVEQIIDEKTGKMMRFANANIVLENVTCQAYYKNRGCPRSIFPFWREIWLERVGEDGSRASSVETSAKED